MYTYVAGIQRTSIGWDSVEIRPVLLPELQWVNCSFHSPRGRIAVAYSLSAEGALSSEVSTPPGVQGVYVSPRTGARVALQGGVTLVLNE